MLADLTRDKCALIELSHVKEAIIQFSGISFRDRNIAPASEIVVFMEDARDMAFNALRRQRTTTNPIFGHMVCIVGLSH
jgi:hypothetical protein